MKESKEEKKKKIIKTVIYGVIMLALGALLIYWYFIK
jgi:flagellar basal body-associated protein FliL